MYFISFRIACQRPPLDCCVTIMSVRTYFMSHFSRAFRVQGTSSRLGRGCSGRGRPAAGPGRCAGPAAAPPGFRPRGGRGRAQQAESRAGRVPPGRRAPDLPRAWGGRTFHFLVPSGITQFRVCSQVSRSLSSGLSPPGLFGFSFDVVLTNIKATWLCR